MINLSVLKYPMFVLGLIAIFIAFMCILSTMILLPLYLQTGMALATFAAGLVLLPGGILNGLLSPIIGKLFDEYGAKVLVTPGFAIISVVYIFLIQIDQSTSQTQIIILHSVLLIGITLVMSPAQTNGLNQLPRELYPDGTAAYEYITTSIRCNRNSRCYYDYVICSNLAFMKDNATASTVDGFIMASNHRLNSVL